VGRRSERAGGERERHIHRPYRRHPKVFESARAEFFLGLGLDDERPIEWLWPERIPLGMLTVLEGASQTGKSFLVATWRPRLRAGAPWPGQAAGLNTPGEVLFLCGDLDDWERTVFSRLKQAGADAAESGGWHPSRPITRSSKPAKAYTQRPIRLPDDLGQLEYNIRVRPDVRLVVIDSPGAVSAPTTRRIAKTLRH